jgi:hypothetical protein
VLIFPLQKGFPALSGMSQDLSVSDICHYWWLIFDRIGIKGVLNNRVQSSTVKSTMLNYFEL